MESPAVRFVRALAAKDRSALLDVLHPDVSFLGVTPRRCWEVSGARALVDEVLLGSWFEQQDRIDEVSHLDVGSLGDLTRLTYRFAVRDAAGAPHVVEQQGYVRDDGSRIRYLRIVCSGWLPLSFHSDS